MPRSASDSLTKRASFHLRVDIPHGRYAALMVRLDLVWPVGEQLNFVAAKTVNRLESDLRPVLTAMLAEAETWPERNWRSWLLSAVASVMQPLSEPVLAPWNAPPPAAGKGFAATLRARCVGQRNRTDYTPFLLAPLHKVGGEDEDRFRAAVRQSMLSFAGAPASAMTRRRMTAELLNVMAHAQRAGLIQATGAPVARDQSDLGADVDAPLDCDEVLFFPV